MLFKQFYKQSLWLVFFVQKSVVIPYDFTDILQFSYNMNWRFVLQRERTGLPLIVAKVITEKRKREKKEKKDKTKSVLFNLVSQLSEI